MIVFQIVSLFTLDPRMSRFRFANSMMLPLFHFQISYHALSFQTLVLRTTLLPLYHTFTHLISQLSKHAIKLLMYLSLEQNYLPLDVVSTKQLVFQTSSKSLSLLIHCMLQRESSTCFLISISYNLLLYLIN